MFIWISKENVEITIFVYKVSKLLFVLQKPKLCCLQDNINNISKWNAMNKYAEKNYMYIFFISDRTFTCITLSQNVNSFLTSLCNITNTKLLQL